MISFESGKKQKQTEGLERMLLRFPNWASLRLHREEAHRTSASLCLPGQGSKRHHVFISHIRRILEPMWPCPSCARREILIKGGSLHTEGQFRVGDWFDQTPFLPELIDLSCGLAKTHWGRQGQPRDNAGSLWPLEQNRNGSWPVMAG